MPTVDNEFSPTQSSQSGGSRQLKPLPAFKAPPRQHLSTGTRSRAPEHCSPPAPQHLQPRGRDTPGPQPRACLLPPFDIYTMPDTTALGSILKVTTTVQELHSEHPRASSFPRSQVLQKQGTCVKHIPVLQPSYAQRGGHGLRDAPSLQGLQHCQVPHLHLSTGWDPLGKG